MTHSDTASSPPHRWRWVLWLLAVVLVVFVVWRMVHHGAATQHGHPDAAPIVVSTASIARGDIRVLLNGLGTVTPLANVTVRTQINGILTQVGFTEGQMVQKGDFLAQIDPRPYQVALEQAQGALARDTALLQEARIDAARYGKLLKEDSIAGQQVDTQRSLVHQYEGTVQTDQAAIDAAKLNLIYCHITAPVTGRVGLRQVDAGNYVQTSDTNGLVVLTQLQPISVIFALPEDDLPAINKQTGPLAVTVSDRSDSHQLDVGTLSTTDNQVDTSTGTVRIRAIFDNKNNTLFPNQFVNAQLLVETHHNVVMVPSAAVQRGVPGTFAYVVQPDSTVALRQLVIGPQDGDNIEIISGLNAGESVVTDGADKLRAGMKVKVAPPPNAAAAETGASPDAHQRSGHKQSGAQSR